MEFPVRVPFVEHLGCELLSVDAAHSALRLQPRAEHLNSHGMVHGGVLMTLLDVTMAMAARAGRADVGVVTIEMKTTFMLPASGPLSARGAVKVKTSNMAFVEATVFDARDRMCSHATGTFKFVHQGQHPGGGKSGAPVVTD